MTIVPVKGNLRMNELTWKQLVLISSNPYGKIIMKEKTKQNTIM